MLPVKRKSSRGTLSNFFIGGTSTLRDLLLKARKRKAGGGRKGNLHSVEQKLLFALVYQKTYPLQALIGEVFELSQSRANDWIHRLLPVLKQTLANLKVLPERNPRQFARRKKRKAETVELIIDGTERRRQRPKNPEKQILHYSGKNKVHSDKNVLLVDIKTKCVDYLSQTCVGKSHDKKIAENERISYPRETTLHKDTGFQGYEPRVQKTLQPKKDLATESYCTSALTQFNVHAFFFLYCGEIPLIITKL